jgi:hypothetical protein
LTDGDFETANYDPINHLNAIFAHPSALYSVNETATALQAHQDALDISITELTASRAVASADDSLTRMSSAKAELAQLFRKIESVRNRALETEQTITSMTAEIKRLDNTKRNLTLSMTALKRLQMLTTAYEQLRGLAKSRQYRECASLLQAVIQLMAHFKSYRSIDQIATLSRNVADLQRELGEQVCEDFELAFAKGEVASRKGVLNEACLVMDALGDTARGRLITWYCNTQLREYRHVFRGNDEAGSLDNIGRRYSWFKRMWKVLEDEHLNIFPPSWRVDEQLANAFCEGTRDDYKAILEKQTRSGSSNLDVSLLLRCLQETLDFEHTLEKKFGSDPRASIDTLASDSELKRRFDGSISKAFEPYLSLWVDSRDAQLAGMIPTYRTTALLPQDEEFSPQAVIASSIELFHFYKLTLAQCAKLSTSGRLLDLSRTFAKYLDEYAQQVLLHILQRGGGSGPPLQEIILVLNTADYWHVNSTQLADNIGKRIDADLASQVDFSDQSDTFMGVASAALSALVQKVESNLEPAWREMRNTNWRTMESVGDQSSYVAELLRRVVEPCQEILSLVHKPQYARAFCDNVIEHVTQAYLNNIVQSRPVSETGAEQLLLDKYVMTTSLSTLVDMSPAASSHAHSVAAFKKRVPASLGKLDPLLKTLQVRPAPPEGLVQAYLIHIKDRNEANFRKILDLKGIRKGEQPALVEMFTLHRDSPRYADLVQQNPLLTPLSLSGDSGKGLGINGIAAAATSSIPTASGLSSAATFGEKLFSGVREGVERIGTTGSPVLGGGGSSIGAPGQRERSVERETSVQENLRGLGKFFSREGRTFTGRFGRGGASEADAK